MQLSRRCAAVLLVVLAAAVPVTLGQASRSSAPTAAPNARDVQASARMSSANVIGSKSNNTSTGTCTLTTSGVNARWTLNLANVQGLGAVHLHRDPALADTGTNPALVTLTTIAQPNPSTVTLQGSFTALNFNPSGALNGQGLSALNSLVNAKAVYCDVHPSVTGPPFGPSQIQGTLMSGLGG